MGMMSKTAKRHIIYCAVPTTRLSRPWPCRLDAPKQITRTETKLRGDRKSPKTKIVSILSGILLSLCFSSDQIWVIDNAHRVIVKKDRWWGYLPSATVFVFSLNGDVVALALDIFVDSDKTPPTSRLLCS